MKIRPDTGLSFDDVLLVPKKSDIQSRKDVCLKTRAAKGLEIDIPIISANMDTVTESEMAITLGRLGGLGIVHRFMANDRLWGQVGVLSSPRDFGFASNRQNFGLSVGLKDAEVELLSLCDLVVIDVAHGHHSQVLTAIKELVARGFRVMAGNIATAEAAKDLCEAGADAVKVGIGPGSRCTTRIETGAGVPQLTAIADVAQVCKNYGVPVCADGGIRAAGDIVKALAAGADTVMIGRLLAGTDESPGKIVEKNGRLIKDYRGSASYESKVANGMRAEHIEGHSEEVPYVGSLELVVKRLTDGVRSGMSYCGARTIPELKEKAEFIRVTSNDHHLK